jgi:hypothetical protein
MQSSLLTSIHLVHGLRVTRVFCMDPNPQQKDILVLGLINEKFPFLVATTVVTQSLPPIKLESRNKS